MSEDIIRNDLQLSDEEEEEQITAQKVIEINLRVV